MRALLANLVLSVCTLIIALFLGELVVRLVAPQPLIRVRPDLWRAADTLGWAPRPEVAVTINTGERTVVVMTDRDGYRVGERGRIEAPVRLLVVGDSFAGALQVTHEQSFAGRLEAALPGPVGRPVAVRNAGAEGRDPNHYRLVARQALAREPVRLLLVTLYVGNDVVDQRVESFPARSPTLRAKPHWPRRLSSRELLLAVAPINDALELRSQLYILVRSRLEGMRQRMELASREFPREFQRAFADSPSWGVTAGICREIADDAAGRGVPSLFVLIPTYYQPDTSQWMRTIGAYGVDTTTVDRRQPDRLLGVALAAEGLEVIDLLPAFEAAARGGPPLYGQVDQHFTPAGHAVLATTVLPRVAELLRSGPVRRPAAAAPRSRAVAGAH